MCMNTTSYLVTKSKGSRFALKLTSYTGPFGSVHMLGKIQRNDFFLQFFPFSLNFLLLCIDKKECYIVALQVLLGTGATS